VRRLTIQAIAIGLFGVAFHAGSAHACIRFDRVAEVRVIDHAIAAPDTPATQRAELKLLRHKMRMSRGTSSEQLIAYHQAVTQALKVLGKQRIILSDTPARPDRRAAVPAPSGCG